MITALIAYEELDPATRNGLVTVLKGHPRFSQDFKTPMPPGLTTEDQHRWLFCQASIWPDLVRQKADGRIPPDPHIITSYHREHWHFINFPFALLPLGSTPDQVQALEQKAAQHINLDTSVPPQETLQMNVLQAIDYNAGILGNKHNKKADRAVALCWIIHTVGDTHQPLHCTALFTQHIFEPSSNPEGDRGGNRVHYTKTENLHSLWDDAPGSTHTFSFVTNRTQQLLSDPDLRAKGQTASSKANLEEWAKESFTFAKAQACTQPIQTQILTADAAGVNPTNKIVNLPDGYSQAAADLAKQRVVEGGFRLAAKLKASLPH
jgi:hypothetical protein